MIDNSRAEADFACQQGMVRHRQYLVLPEHLAEERHQNLGICQSRQQRDIEYCLTISTVRRCPCKSMRVLSLLLFQHACDLHELTVQCKPFCFEIRIALKRLLKKLLRAVALVGFLLQAGDMLTGSLSKETLRFSVTCTLVCKLGCGKCSDTPWFLFLRILGPLTRAHIIRLLIHGLLIGRMRCEDFRQRHSLKRYRL